MKSSEVDKMTPNEQLVDDAADGQSETVPQPSSWECPECGDVDCHHVHCSYRPKSIGPDWDTRHRDW